MFYMLSVPCVTIPIGLYLCLSAYRVIVVYIRWNVIRASVPECVPCYVRLVCVSVCWSWVVGMYPLSRLLAALVSLGYCAMLGDCASLASYKTA